MKILILNWRDIKNPASGGAEILTHEIAKRWVEWGNKVTIFSAKFSDSKKEDVMDGVTIIRRGNWWSVRLLAPFFYYKNKKNFDVVIDEVHWFPFFSLLYAKRKTVLLACEVADKLFFHVFPAPLAYFWRGLEKIYLFIYRNIPTLAISPSTKEDLIREGFNSNNIKVIPMGLTIPRGVEEQKKESEKTLIFLGRINKQKGIEDVISAYSALYKKNIVKKLWVVGSGEPTYVEKIKEMVESLGISSSVEFFGYVDNVKKFSLLSKAHVLLVPSIHEGWGLTVPEAGHVGTPAIAYYSKGLRDTIKDGVSGFLVGPNPRSLVEGVEKMLQDQNKYNSFRKEAQKLAKIYDWDITARDGLAFLDKIYKRI